MKITYNVQAPDRRGFAKSEEVKAIEDFLTSGNAKNMCFEYDTKEEAKNKLATISGHNSRGGSDTLTRSGLACGLKTSPPLTPTDIIREGVTPYVNGGCKDAHGNYRRFQGRNERDPKTRSKTFPGVAQAMAQQWGGDMSG